MKRLAMLFILGLVISQISGCAFDSLRPPVTFISLNKDGKMLDKDGNQVSQITVRGRAYILTPPDENGEIFFIDTSHPRFHAIMSRDENDEMTQKMSFPVGSSRYNQWLGGYGYNWGFGGGSSRNAWKKHTQKRWR